MSVVGQEPRTCRGEYGIFHYESFSPYPRVMAGARRSNLRSFGKVRKGGRALRIRGREEKARGREMREYDIVGRCYQ